ncbi:hypothetical protein EVAR_2556_1 [Eumeta japonica]|uniref:Uncharacterized protein n=1 Tax=Eumeta variegata TaxID=151549 RepID=A0A4C1SP17_EUMVA|nr:hypothetical protein EVAR_2556_1 [Eumeta japonica]
MDVTSHINIRINDNGCNWKVNWGPHHNGYVVLNSITNESGRPLVGGRPFNTHTGIFGGHDPTPLSPRLQVVAIVEGKARLLQERIDVCRTAERKRRRARLIEFP